MLWPVQRMQENCLLGFVKGLMGYQVQGDADEVLHLILMSLLSHTI